MRLHAPRMLLLAAWALVLAACTTASTISQQSDEPAGGARRLLAPPPISVTGWPSSSTGTIASNLAALLVDTGKFTIASASYAGDKSCAGKAAFQYFGEGPSGWTPPHGGPAPGHFLAPWLRPSTASGLTNGVSAVMLSTAKILGSSFPIDAPYSRSTVKGASQTEIPGNVRSTKLTLRLTALANGYLRMPWTWSDGTVSAEFTAEGYGSDAQNLMRILVNGMDRSVTSDNRYVRHSSFWQQNPDPTDRDPWTLGDVAAVRHDYYGYYTPDDDPTLTIEFGGIAFMYTTKRVLVKSGETITITFLLGDMPDIPGGGSSFPQGPTALYLKPKSITLTSVTSCSSSKPCSSSTQRCCGGFCCSTSVKCCSGECCASDGFNCLPFVLGGKASCCSKSATCNGGTLCCPPGSRCVNGTSCQQ